MIPKSVHKERMAENIAIWDFELTQDEMEKIAKLDMGHSEIVDHSNPEFVKALHGMRIHD